jgi:hypothetical protein
MVIMKFVQSGFAQSTTSRRWSMALILRLTCLLLGAFLVLPVWSQTQHSITVAISGYTQGVDLATGFNFYRSTVSGGPYVKLNSTPVLLATAQFVDTTGVGNTKYFYVATAVDASGFESAFSGEANATFLSNPATPPAVTLTVK